MAFSNREQSSHLMYVTPRIFVVQECCLHLGPNYVKQLRVSLTNREGCLYFNMKASRKIPKRTIQCNQCDKRFSTLFACNLHMHVHQSSKSSWFPCRSCGRKFSKIVSLLKHREIHPPPRKKQIDKRLPAHLRKNDVEASRNIDKSERELHESIISESEAIRIATEAENVKVADLPIRKPIAKGYSGDGLSRISDNRPSETLNSRNSPRAPDCLGNGYSDLQVSIVSSTDFSSCAPKMPPSETSASEKSCIGECLKCDICERTLSSSRSFQNHMNIHNSKNRHICPSCGKSYAWRTSLIDHFKVTTCGSKIDFDIGSHPSESEAPLSIVEEISKKELATRTRKSSSIHTEKMAPQSQTDTRRVDCSILKSKAGRSAKFSFYQAIVSSKNHNDSLQEDGCNQRGIKSRNVSVLYPSREDKDFMYPCVDCGKPFRNEDLMWKHFEVSHCVLDHSPSPSTIAIRPNPGRKSYECPVCRKVLSSALGLKEHLSKHTGAKNFSCPTCGRRFAWRGSVRKHLLRTPCGDGRKKPLPSGSTQSQTHTKRITVAHKNSPKNQRQTKFNEISADIVNVSNSVPSKQLSSCKVDQVGAICDPKSGRKKSLDVSGLLEVKKYAVVVEEFVRNSILCQEGFGVKKEMLGFVDVGNAPERGRHCCRICGNVYKYKSSLKIHMRCHTGEIPYQCKICKQRFATHKYCRKHVLNHGRESDSEVLRSAVRQMMESKPWRKESTRHATESESKFSEPNISFRKEVQSIVQEQQGNREELRYDQRGQNNEKFETPQSSCESAMKVKKPLSGNDKQAFNSAVYSLGENDPSKIERRAHRQARKRSVKYFDLEEDPDDDFPMKKRRKNLSKVVEDSLGMNDSAEEEETYQDETPFKTKKSSCRKRAESGASEEEGVNSSLQPNLSNAGNFLGLQNPTSPSLPTKVDGTNDSKESLKLLFQCKICNTKFSSRFVLRRHEVITGHTKASYECPYCKRIYSEGGAYSNHMFVHQRENGMNCDICGKELQSRTTFLNHVEMHRKNPFNCELCFEWFPTAKKLQEHLDVAHDDQKEFKCKYCKKTFDWQSNYSRHLNKHTNKKEFKCKICHYSFNIISNLKRHMTSVHKGETELSKSTWEAVNPAQVDHVLNRQHQRRDLWKVKRDEGDDSAGPEKRRGRLKALRAENRKKYNCGICEFLCSSRVELTNHLRFAHKQGNNPETAFIHFIIEDENFVCQLCGSVIYIRHSLKNHMRRVHSMEIDDNDIAGVSKFKALPQRKGEKDDDVEGGAVQEGGTRKKLIRNKVKGKSRGSPDRTKLSNVTRRVKSRATNTLSSQERATSVVSEEASDRQDYLSLSQAKTDERINCSLCKDTFQSTKLLVQHLHTFHKIPAGLEESLIALTKDVSGYKSDAHCSSMAIKATLGKKQPGIDPKKATNRLQER